MFRNGRGTPVAHVRYADIESVAGIEVYDVVAGRGNGDEAQLGKQSEGILLQLATILKFLDAYVAPALRPFRITDRPYWPPGLGMRVQISEHKDSVDVRVGPVRHHPSRERYRVSSLPANERGGIVDDHALACALTNGEIGGAGLDVLSEEPPRHGNPLLDLSVGNLVVTAHTAWVSQSALAAFSEQLIQNLESFVSGRPQNELTKRLRVSLGGAHT